MSSVVRAPESQPETQDDPILEPVACLACGGTQATHFISGEDDLTGKPGRFTFVKCASCGLVYQNPRLSLEQIRKYYDDDYIAHQPHRRWGLLAPLFRAAIGSLDRAKLRIVRRAVTITPESRVLDVGCGSGSFLARLNAETGARTTGVDLIDLSRRPELQRVVSGTPTTRWPRVAG
jgi:hypothetical protein